jgi:hypothetical protein
MILRSILRVGVVTMAVAAALLPLPRWAVERWYSEGIYPTLQANLTSVTNRIPVALLDVCLALLVIVVVWRLMRRLRSTSGPRALASAALGLVTSSAVIYLAFLALWGLNYRRVPLKDKVEFDEARITQAAAVAFAREAVGRLNTLYPDAHLGMPPGRTLEEAFGAAQARLGSSRGAVPGIAKRSVLEMYFRWAAIDGMTNPFFLEIIVNPDVLPIEQPFVLAHEWAHLAGYADESEASLLAWMTCLEGNALAQYSGWMAMFGQVRSELPVETQRQIFALLEPGPRQDFGAIAARWRRSRPVVRNLARETYDVFLRANSVEAGIESYDQVVRLILGAGAENAWAPRPRSR